MKTKIILSFIVLIVTVFPALGQTVNDEIYLNLQQTVQIEKNTDTDQHTGAGNGNEIGNELADTDEVVYRTYFRFDLSELADFHNVTVNEVWIFYNTGNTDSYTFKLTGPSSIDDPSAYESNWNAIGNADTKESGIIYGNNNISSSGIKSYVESQLSSEELIVGALSEDEDSVGSSSSLSLDILVKFSYEGYSVTVRNDFKGQYGGQVGVGKNTSAGIKSSPYVLGDVQNDDDINLQAYDNQNIYGYTWVFNNTEAPENKSRWRIIKNGATTNIHNSTSQTNSRTANNDQDAIIFNEQKRVFSITRNDYSPELGSNINSANVQVVEGNTISAPLTQTDNGVSYQFIEWSDGETANPRTISSPTSFLMARYKALQASNDATAYANNSQRKVVRTSDGWLHMVYESLGRVWLEHSDDDGATWTLADNGNPLDAGAGKNPSIDWLYAGSTYGNYVVVVYQQKNGSDYKIMGKIFKRGSSGYYKHTTFNMGTVGSTESYSVDANPNITLGGDPDNTGAGDFTLTVEKKSGTAGIYYLYGVLSGNGDIMSSSDPTRLSGTNANSTNTSVHINKMYNNLDVFHIVYQQGSGSIKRKFIECSRDYYNDVWSCSDTYTSNLSSSTGQQNYKPSMVQMPGGGLKVSWIRALYGQSSPYWMNTVYWSSSSPSQYTIRGYFVRSVSLNVSNDNTKYLYAWSEQINSWYANYLSNGSSSNTKLSTIGEEVQLSNGTGSGANMLVSSFNRTSAPYTFKNTGNIGGSFSKVSSDAPINYGRGVALHKDDLRFNYTLKSLSVDGRNIQFVEIPQDKPDSAKSNGRWEVKYLKLKKLNKYILSEPFDIDNQTGISFSDEAGFIDSAQAVTVLGRNGYIRYKVELVDERTNEVIRLLNEAEYSAAHLPQDTLNSYIGNTGETTNRTARVKITISSNMDDLQGVLISEYGTTDNEMLSKMAAQTHELTPAEEVTSYALGQNYPNPFNPSTVISYQLPASSEVLLEVFDLLGRKVQTLVNEQQSTGRYNVTFNASHLASGVYLYRIKAGEFTESKKLFLIK